MFCSVLKMMGKKIITILHSKLLLNWTYECHHHDVKVCKTYILSRLVNAFMSSVHVHFHLDFEILKGTATLMISMFYQKKLYEP